MRVEERVVVRWKRGVGRKRIKVKEERPKRVVRWRRRRRGCNVEE